MSRINKHKQINVQPFTTRWTFIICQLQIFDNYKHFMKSLNLYYYNIFILFIDTLIYKKSLIKYRREGSEQQFWNWKVLLNFCCINIILNATEIIFNQVLLIVMQIILVQLVLNTKSWYALSSLNDCLALCLEI